MSYSGSNTESFNARYMTFNQVAESFIVTSDYLKIIKNNHTILVGSRGCGKTTLLKMLHPQAIMYRDSLNTNSLMDQIPFYGVYIPSDKQWNKQIEVFEKTFENNPDFVRAISRGIVNLNILIALCDNFKTLINIGLGDQSDYDVLLSIELIDLWKLPKPITPNLYSITQRFLSYVEDLNIIINRADTNCILNDFCYWDFVNKTEIAINAFEERFKDIDFFKKRPFKWALCFDELEIAPKWLFDELIKKHLRSRSQKIIFKMTTIPEVSRDIVMPTDSDNFSSTLGDDYESVPMWVYNNRSQANWHEFCEKYLLKILRNKFNKNLAPKLFFGDHDYNIGLREYDRSKFSSKYTSKQETEFDKGGIMWYVMMELAEKDNSFKAYLIRKGIDPSNPIPTKKGQIDQVHRKIKPIVLYRYYFNKDENQKRTRKVLSYNHGRDYIYDFADGNPRAFVNLINEFIPEFKLNKNGDPIKIPVNRQASIISNFCIDYFYPRIAYYAESVIKYKGKTITLENIVNYIGNYFREQYIGKTFYSDPFSRIRFDNKCPKEIEKLFNKGLESGGILALEEEFSTIAKKNEMGIYRLSYSLFPYYGLPQRSYAIKNLSEILEPILKIEDNLSQLTINF